VASAEATKGIVNTTHILPAKFILEAHFTLSWNVQRSNEWQTLKRRDSSQLSKSKYNDTINRYSPKPAPPSAAGSKAELSEFMHGMQVATLSPKRGGQWSDYRVTLGALGGTSTK
jgi:hypothetical protein